MDSTLELFDAWWVYAAEQGFCDEMGGAEYDRVRSEWINAGMPYNMWGFIYWRANVGPEDPSVFKNGKEQIVDGT